VADRVIPPVRKARISCANRLTGYLFEITPSTNNLSGILRCYIAPSQAPTSLSSKEAQRNLDGRVLFGWESDLAD